MTNSTGNTKANRTRRDNDAFEFVQREFKAALKARTLVANEARSKSLWRLWKAGRVVVVVKAGEPMFVPATITKDELATLGAELRAGTGIFPRD